MTKRIFKLRKVVAIVICLAGVTFFSGCDKDPDPIDNGTEQEANIVTFTFAGIDGTATIDKTTHTVTAKAKETTDLTAIKAEFTLSKNATAKVGSTAQVSGQTANNFTSPVIYKVTSGDGKTTQDWTITISKEGGTSGGTWTLVTAGNNPLYGEQDFLCVAYGGGKFVATGQKGLIAYSTDGVTWTETKNHPIPEPSQIYDCTMWSIAYGNGKFVAVGERNMVVYSTDGITWTQATIPMNINDLFSVAYGNGKFVIAGNGRQRVYSADGINWTASTDENFLNTLTAFSIAYGGGNFVAVGESNKISYSADGITWTHTASPFVASGSAIIQSVAYGNGKFLANKFGANGAMAYSTDNGITWTISWENAFAGNTLCIMHDGNKFIAGNMQGMMGYSTDGITWTTLTADETGFKPGNQGKPIYGIAYNGNDTYVAVGSGGCIAYLKK